jgi:CspA family cold shock protein
MDDTFNTALNSDLPVRGGRGLAGAYSRVPRRVKHGDWHSEWFNSQKGYGFIQPTGGGGGRDVFVHISAVERAGLSSLNEGQHVEFEIEENRGKSSAINLRVK